MGQGLRRKKCRRVTVGSPATLTASVPSQVRQRPSIVKHSEKRSLKVATVSVIGGNKRERERHTHTEYALTTRSLICA